MLEYKAIESIADRIAKGHGVGVDRIVARPTVDSEGKDAIRVTLVLPAGAAEELSGDASLDLLYELDQALQGEGEERMAIVEYATQEEIEEEEARATDAFSEGDDGSEPEN
jgi:hypothetical protein